MKPYKENNWENLTYWPEKRGEGKPYRAKEKVTVTWPNGDVTQETIVGKAHRAQVSDMGHAYVVSTTKLFIIKDHQGVRVSIPLEDLDVQR